MQYEFLKNFPKRMKNVGLYGVLIQNSIQKTSWKQFGFLKFDEQMNLIFAVMLYIMEQSLREENCTMDDIGAYIDTINTRYLGKEISYDDCRKLGDFVVRSYQMKAVPCILTAMILKRTIIMSCISAMWRTGSCIWIRRFAELLIILQTTDTI